MVSIRIDKKRLLRDLSREESGELWDDILMMGVEIDDNTADELVVDITPNRPDLLSQAGFTRAAQAFLGIKPGLRQYKSAPSKLKVTVDASLRDIRPATACAVVRGLKLDEEKLKEIIDIQEKLHVTFCRKRKRAAIGVYPMDAISGNITFTALPPKEIRFRPLEADREMTGGEILAEHPKGRDFAHLLAGLPRYPVFLDSKGKVLSMPPIINSHDVGKVELSTTDIFIEASGSDFRVCHEIVRIICCALADMGGSVQTVQVVYGKRTEITPDLSPSRQAFFGYYVSRRLGVDIPAEHFAQLLARMGLGVEEGRIRDTYHAIIPPYRVDFLHQVDVVEDVAIAYGYNRIPAKLPDLATVAGESRTTIFARTVRKTLVGFGLLEAKNYHLASKKDQEALGHARVVTLAGSVSQEHDSMRASLTVSLLSTLAVNRVYEYPQSFFEIGTVFSPADDHVIERQHLGIALADNAADYTRIRQVVDALFTGLGFRAAYAAGTDSRFMAGRCARLTVDGREVGLIGELSPAVLSHAGIVTPIAAAELDLDAIRDAVLPRSS